MPAQDSPTQYLTSDRDGSLYGTNPTPPPVADSPQNTGYEPTRATSRSEALSQPARPPSHASEASSMYFFKKDQHGRYRLADQNERRKKEEKRGLDTLITKAQRRSLRVNASLADTDSRTGGQVWDISQSVLHNIFDEMDTDRDGLVGLKSFSEGLRRLGLYATLPTSDIEVIFREYDFDGSGMINFNGFYKAYKLLCWKLRIKSILRKVFMIMDDDKDGYINLDNFASGLRKHNLYEKLNNSYIGVIFKEFDNGTGRISWPEFWARYKTLEVRLKKRGQEDRWIVDFLDALYDNT